MSDKTRKVDKSLPDVAKSSRNSSRRRADRGSVDRLCYSELTITVCIDPVTNMYVKAACGHEFTSPTESDYDLKRAFAKARSFNEGELEREVKRAKKLIRQILAARERD